MEIDMSQWFSKYSYSQCPPHSGWSSSLHTFTVSAVLVRQFCRLDLGIFLWTCITCPLFQWKCAFVLGGHM